MNIYFKNTPYEFSSHVRDMFVMEKGIRELIGDKVPSIHTYFRTNSTLHRELSTTKNTSYLAVTYRRLYKLFPRESQTSEFKSATTLFFNLPIEAYCVNDYIETYRLIISFMETCESRNSLSA